MVKVENVVRNVEFTWDISLKYLRAFWEFKVAVIDGNAVTAANIIIAIVIFSIGFYLSRKISRLLVGIAPATNKLNENTLSMVESVAFYSFLIIFTFTALSVAQIPLKTFALLGGALAIGFGFGSQNIIKNFISGIILMIEQPIRVGDIISAEDTEGRVIRIGARSTHLRTYDNVDILVPNSILLENNVVNWTLSDEDIRTRVLIGVAYGSDTKKVDSLLKEVVSKNPKVLANRQTMVFFNDFGDNSLNFEVQFWCKMPRPSARRKVESQIRHDINEAFEKAGIVIAFPQRDVHIDSLSPIEIKMVRPRGETKN